MEIGHPVVTIKVSADLVQAQGVRAESLDLFGRPITGQAMLQSKAGGGRIGAADQFRAVVSSRILPTGYVMHRSNAAQDKDDCPLGASAA